MSKQRKYQECHKCQYNGQGNNACLSCAGNDDYTATTHCVSVEALQGTQEEPRAKANETYFNDTIEPTENDTKAIASFAVSLLQLSPEEYAVVAKMLFTPCPNWSKIAKDVGLSRDQLYRRVNSAIKKVPSLSKAIIPPHKRHKSRTN